LKIRDVIKLVEKDGWYQAAQKGSHRQYKHPTKPGYVTIAGHPRDDVAAGTLQSIPEASRVEMKYAVVYEKTATGYSAYVPDLPWCITTGRSLEQTERLMKEAIEFHLEGMREDGAPIPKPRTITEIRQSRSHGRGCPE
jgi:predicted RNA binding protein YcfA (HicA-like mRNA interferase family)/predicted RNase H-like HicB family nuclease